MEKLKSLTLAYLVIILIFGLTFYRTKLSAAMLPIIIFPYLITINSFVNSSFIKKNILYIITLQFLVFFAYSLITAKSIQMIYSFKSSLFVLLIETFGSSLSIFALPPLNLLILFWLAQKAGEINSIKFKLKLGNKSLEKEIKLNFPKYLKNLKSKKVRLAICIIVLLASFFFYPILSPEFKEFPRAFLSSAFTGEGIESIIYRWDNGTDINL